MRVIPPITITDTMLTSSTVSEPADGESAWSATALYAENDEVILGNLSSTVTISSGSPCVVTWAGNNLAVGTPLTLTTDGTLPTGLEVDTVYYVERRLSASTFRISATKFGPALKTTGAGSGTHTATAHVHRTYTALVGQTSTVTITNASPGVVTYTAHGIAANTPVVFTTTGGLPTGLTAGTTYYVRNVLSNDTFTVSATIGGTEINTSSDGTGTHTGGLASTYNKPPMLYTDVWADSGPTLKWAAFDVMRNTASSGDSPLTKVVTPGQRIDSIAMLGIVGREVTVTVDSVLGGGEVYSATEDLSTRYVASWYEYFFRPFTYRTGLVLFDLPPYTDAVITATVTGVSPVELGALVLGINEYIGDAQYGAENDVQNFSRVDRDEFGSASLVQRRSVPKTVQQIFLDKSLVDRVIDLREGLNAIPAVWAGVEDQDDGWFQSLLVLGFYRRFSINIDYPEHALVSLELEEI